MNEPNQTIKRPAGRPKLGAKPTRGRNITIDPDDLALLLELGHGNASAGVRAALRIVQSVMRLDGK